MIPSSERPSEARAALQRTFSGLGGGDIGDMVGLLWLAQRRAKSGRPSSGRIPKPKTGGVISQRVSSSVERDTQSFASSELPQAPQRPCPCAPMCCPKPPSELVSRRPWPSREQRQALQRYRPWPPVRNLLSFSGVACGRP